MGPHSAKGGGAMPSEGDDRRALCDDECVGASWLGQQEQCVGKMATQAGMITRPCVWMREANEWRLAMARPTEQVAWGTASVDNAVADMAATWWDCLATGAGWHRTTKDAGNANTSSAETA